MIGGESCHASTDQLLVNFFILFFVVIKRCLKMDMMGFNLSDFGDHTVVPPVVDEVESDPGFFEQMWSRIVDRKKSTAELSQKDAQNRFSGWLLILIFFLLIFVAFAPIVALIWLVFLYQLIVANNDGLKQGIVVC